MSVLALSDLKLRLNKSSALTVDDVELQSMLDAAEAEYADYIGPVSTGPVTARFSGGGTQIVLPLNVSAITAASYTDGTTISLDDLDYDPVSGLLGWGYNTTGYFTRGARNVVLTYTVTDLPANHREVILADVAGYFEATQNNNGSANFPGEGYEQGYTSTPQVLFPRIRALAATYPKVG